MKSYMESYTNEEHESYWGDELDDNCNLEYAIDVRRIGINLDKRNLDNENGS